MYQKNLWEKIGDLLSHPGKRFLLGMLSVLILGPFGVFIAISVLEHSKTYFVSNINVRTSTGENIPCAIVKQKCYAYMPVVPIVSLFFYIPYKTNYYLLKNVSAPELKNGMQVYETILHAGLVKMELIPKSKFLAIQSNPQIIEKEITGQLEQSRAQFLQDAKPFFETGLLEEICATNTFSICKLEEAHVLFHYCNDDKWQCGIIINESYIKKGHNPSSLLSVYLTIEPETLTKRLIELSDSSLQRLIRNRNTKNENNAAVSKNLLTETEKRKALLTKSMIEDTLKRKTSTSRQALGWILCLPALFAVELGVAGLFTGLIIMGLIFLPLGVWLSYIAIKKIRQGRQNKADIQNGNYRIVETLCESVSKKVYEDSDGTSVSYTVVFANGESTTVQSPIGVAGDTFYLVYLKNSKKAEAYINGIQYTPEHGLVIEKDECIKNKDTVHIETNSEPPKPLNACFACGKPINSTDNFCKYCGAAQQKN